MISELNTRPPETSDAPIQAAQAVLPMPASGWSSGGGRLESLLRTCYYLLKPYLPWSLRVSLRRIRAKRRRRMFAATWPINPAAGQPPPRWRGWPKGKSFAVVLSHDVEGEKGVARCEQLAEVERSLGFRSSFNFIPEGEYRVSAALRARLEAGGFEVGIHDLKHDGKLYSSEAVFNNHAQGINQYLREWNVVGFRSGFMHHNLDWLRRLNVLYDSSTFDTDPFEPQPDGMGTIFPFWVVGKQPAGGYVELPYTLVQDFTLFIVLQERTTDLWKRKVRWIAERGGMALVNVHPDYVCFDGSPRAGEFSVELYREWLQDLAATYRDAYWAALPREVAQFVAENKDTVQHLQLD